MVSIPRIKSKVFSISRSVDRVGLKRLPAGIQALGCQWQPGPRNDLVPTYASQTAEFHAKKGQKLDL